MSPTASSAAASAGARSMTSWSTAMAVATKAVDRPVKRIWFREDDMRRRPLPPAGGDPVSRAIAGGGRRSRSRGRDPDGGRLDHLIAGAAFAQGNVANGVDRWRSRASANMPCTRCRAYRWSIACSRTPILPVWAGVRSAVRRTPSRSKASSTNWRTGGPGAAIRSGGRCAARRRISCEGTRYLGREGRLEQKNGARQRPRHRDP